MTIAVAGAGAFGTALAITLAQQEEVTLWARNADHAGTMQKDRVNSARLPECTFPDNLTTTFNLTDIADAEAILLAIPLQQLRAFMTRAASCIESGPLVACCKGIELDTGKGPLEIIADQCPDTPTALLTGPSFAKDIAKGLPTALTLACTDAELGERLQVMLSTSTLRLYRTQDTIGATLGGALKNVIAIASGAAIGAGLGDSARAALMTRGNAEMQRLAALRGADPATLSGLSGFGDLVLTCTSEQSRNYRFGLSIGARTEFDPETTVEGAATARALAAEAARDGLDLPITKAVAALVEKRLDVADAMTVLLSRSLQEE